MKVDVLTASTTVGIAHIGVLTALLVTTIRNRLFRKNEVYFAIASGLALAVLVAWGERYSSWTVTVLYGLSCGLALHAGNFLTTQRAIEFLGARDRAIWRGVWMLLGAGTFAAYSLLLARFGGLVIHRAQDFWAPAIGLRAVATAVAAAFGEEIYYRHFIQQLLSMHFNKSYGKHLAVLATAALFTVTHIDAACVIERYMQILPCGIALGYAYERWGLTGSIGLHCTVNCVALVVFNLT